MSSSGLAARPSLERGLNAIRTHLGMEVAFISEFVNGSRVFRHVDAQAANAPIRVGASDPLEDSYCQRVVDGRLPELITDACLNAEALTLAATQALPVGAHLSVPIRLADGQLYGTFCCFSRSADHSLTRRDLDMMRAFAQMAAEEIQEELTAREARRFIEERIDAVCNAQGLTMVYQPIVDVSNARVGGFESLARFSPQPVRPPDVWFAEAAHVGRAVEMETKAIRLALAALQHLPPDIYVTVNTSPETIVHGQFASMLEGYALERVVVEVTEHQVVECYEDLAAVMLPLQSKGLRVAIDDAGAGYASFRHILNLHPNIVKMDSSITHCIDADRSRRALAAAMHGFAAETGCHLVAEGVETMAELETIRRLGIGKAQGYHLGRPMPLEQAKGLVGRTAH
ncbi:sensor domain-containing phosphodiesterase [Roseateles sp. DB2]|uniref:sensor domain-containing phosphodiesterase n=1 Tax=Roseateles sp. DB2 TaxID=3453717 RepID=UPI003EE9A579